MRRGFIDLHNHSDFQVIDPQKSGLVNYLTQGCTTIVTGNCGFGPVDVAEFHKKLTDAGVGNEYCPSSRSRLFAK